MSLRHPYNLLRGLGDAATTALSNPILVQCSADDPGVLVPKIVLAAISPKLLRECLDDVAYEADAAVLIPEADAEQVRRFFGLLGKKGEELDKAETECVQKVVEWLGVEGFKGEIVQSQAVIKPPKKRTRKKRIAEVKDSDPVVTSFSSFGRARKRAKKFDEEEEEEERGLVPEGGDFDDDLQDAETLFERKPIGSGNIACAFCWKKYHHVKARNKHMLGEHTDDCRERNWYFPCSLCDMVFVAQNGREKHHARVHIDQDKPESDIEVEVKKINFSCPFPHGGEKENVENTVVVTSLRELRSHIKEAHPDKDKSCFVCGQEFKLKKELSEHIQNHEEPESRILLSCEHCKLKFISEYGLTLHKRETHSQLATLDCQHCGKSFKNSKFLSNHLQKHRAGEPDNEQFECQVTLPDGRICGKVYPVKANLERHLRSHTGFKPFPCSTCGKTFVDSTRLKQHRWIHSGYCPFKCEVCSRGFRHASHLRSHMVSAHGIEKDFECTTCHKRFTYGYQLRTHSLTHESKVEVTVLPPPPHPDPDQLQTFFQCSTCQSMFQDYPSLQSHCATEHATSLGQNHSEEVFLQVKEIDSVPKVHEGAHNDQQYVIVYDNAE